MKSVYKYMQFWKNFCFEKHIIQESPIIILVFGFCMCTFGKVRMVGASVKQDKQFLFPVLKSAQLKIILPLLVQIMKWFRKLSWIYNSWGILSLIHGYAYYISVSQYFGSETYNATELVKKLIAAGCDVNVVDSQGWCPMFQSAFAGDIGQWFAFLHPTLTAELTFLWMLRSIRNLITGLKI